MCLLYETRLLPGGACGSGPGATAPGPSRRGAAPPASSLPGAQQSLATTSSGDPGGAPAPPAPSESWGRVRVTDGRVYAFPSAAAADPEGAPETHAEGSYGRQYLASLGLPLRPLVGEPGEQVAAPLRSWGDETGDPDEADRAADREAVRRLVERGRFARIRPPSPAASDEGGSRPPASDEGGSRPPSTGAGGGDAVGDDDSSLAGAQPERKEDEGENEDSREAAAPATEAEVATPPAAPAALPEDQRGDEREEVEEEEKKEGEEEEEEGAGGEARRCADGEEASDAGGGSARASGRCGETGLDGGGSASSRGSGPAGGGGEAGAPPRPYNAAPPLLVLYGPGSAYEAWTRNPWSSMAARALRGPAAWRRDLVSQPFVDRRDWSDARAERASRSLDPSQMVPTCSACGESIYGCVREAAGRPLHFGCWLALPESSASN